ncbi:TPA: DUF1642 domain-containing protein [Streptococcus suis]|uniref:DUF1642 domain-containing protein n=1 Tax=Streptococcus suis TaxID=1307 RepID=UPI00209B1B08|nr:DUF1642 domain-containing protein [Streptococcus suis]MCO8207895.1 DUF1642 domain-containing protein [Streptococcus suis]MCO8212347.1 DUF1642 domain-containing protein [Streptococcus suis]MCO8212456.1 DUF1642 domain-containing protein [Streptococcus suis]HEM3492610.1 DUF1642 domain-containing protein [Streptococcus suis]HEM3494901.1 DUF1642 domain-containing protein [Streptococcus suis]
MNKPEAINQIKLLKARETFMSETIWIKQDDVLGIVRKIHEPQKVVIPKFVAEYIERCKQSGWHLQKVLSRLDDDEKVGDWAYDENDDLISEKVDMVARAWLDGYEVEKERLYTVEIPNPHSGNYTYLHRSGSVIKLVTTQFENWKARDYNHFTEAEIKQDFEWAWQWAEAVEVE